MASPKTISRIISLSLLLGGLFGVGMQVYFLGVPAANGVLNIWSTLSLVLFVALFSLCIVAGWRLWRGGRDWKRLGEMLLALQILAFSYGGFGYAFYSGFQIIVGWTGSQIGFKADLGSWGLLMIQGSDNQFRFTVNVAAIVMLIALRKISLFPG